VTEAIQSLYFFACFEPPSFLFDPFFFRSASRPRQDLGLFSYRTWVYPDRFTFCNRPKPQPSPFGGAGTNEHLAPRTGQPGWGMPPISDLLSSPSIVVKYSYPGAASMKSLQVARTTWSILRPSTGPLRSFPSPALQSVLSFFQKSFPAFLLRTHVVPFELGFGRHLRQSHHILAS